MATSYKCECWGAQGGSLGAYSLGSPTGGKGAYTLGLISLASDNAIYIYMLVSKEAELQVGLFLVVAGTEVEMVMLLIMERTVELVVEAVLIYD